MKTIFQLLIGATIIVAGCRKRPDPVAYTPVVSNQIGIAFRNTVNGQPLVLNTGKYINANGDTFSVSKYKYYISNIQFVKRDGSIFEQKNGYYLIDEQDEASMNVTVSGVSDGTYTSIRFLIGVDSARNTAGAQTGALDPLNDMFWDWNTGYIMAKMEGYSPQANETGDNLSFHVGGFAGPYSVLRWVDLTLPSPITLTGASKSNISLASDLAEWFKTPNTINFKTNYVVGSVNKRTAAMADNYADMFSIEKVN